MLCQLLVSVLLLTPAITPVEDKIDGKLLIGKWQPEKLPDGVDKIVVEYSKDNKVTVNLEAQGQMQKIEGTYKLDGDMLTIKLDINGTEQEQKRKIAKLTDSEMTTTDKDKGEDRKYKKVK